MSTTNQTANVKITNNTGGNAFIQMSHKYTGENVSVFCAQAAPGVTVGPMPIQFQTGSSDGADKWYCTVSVEDGPNPGIYATSGLLLNPGLTWDLSTADAGATITNTISTAKFIINPSGGSGSVAVTKLANYSKITNVFVFMLENHSFDHLFGFSGITGINGLSGSESNALNATTSYTVQKGANDPMPVGPGHEFMDTMTQLCGSNTANPFLTGGTSYPAINNSGFVVSYSQNGASTTSTNPTTPPAVSDVMHCCNSQTQIPVLYELATKFAICDQWYSSMPGPTWPNRLFAMGGSSAGLDDSPSGKQVAEWETVDGFVYQNGSFFQQLNKYKKNYRLYNDFDNSFASDPFPIEGSVAIVSALKGIEIPDVNGFEDFSGDINGKYPYQFTWIEPNYGEAFGDFHGGSSQHPVDSLQAGEKMLAAVYNNIRSSPYWATSLLIVTYDEHGGFYDHAAPPGAVEPGDAFAKGLNTCGFNFSQYGIRVPAVIVSPKVPAGMVSGTLYDHTTILKTVEGLFSVGSLTTRDKDANDLSDVVTLTTPRADCPWQITATTPAPAPGAETESLAAVPDIHPELDTRPLPEKGNLHGFLHIAAKTDFELSDRSEAARAAIVARVKSIQTRGEAHQYIREVVEKVKAYKTAQKTGTVIAE